MQEPGENSWGWISRTGGWRIPPPVQGVGIPERREERLGRNRKFVGVFFL